jgi:hypothetical protein
MKVIFLDHDGVTCLSAQWGGRFKKRRKYCDKHGPTEDAKLPVDLRFDNFDIKAVKILNEILTECSAEIVVSSDWKLYCNLDEMKDLYDKYEILKTPLAFTPNLKDFDSDTAGLFAWKGWSERTRILEIEEYLKHHPEVTHWVAVDDLNMGREGLTNFVLCPRGNEGIKQCGIKEKIIEFLKDETGNK